VGGLLIVVEPMTERQRQAHKRLQAVLPSRIGIPAEKDVKALLERIALAQRSMREAPKPALERGRGRALSADERAIARKYGWA
jgi:hypothetical protein